MMYQPQQMGIAIEVARAMEGDQVTILDMRRVMDATLTFGMSVIFGTMMGFLLRSLLREMLEPEQKKAIRPAIDVILPQTKRGELLVRYTGGPQRFAFPDGLEGEIRNFAGHQWVISDTPRNRQVIRESRRWVIARDQPAHLRRRSPGLMPATTRTAEQIFARAKEYFGTTTNPNEAGYILPDGAMLDFSGRKFNNGRGERLLDHRDIAFAWPEADSPGGFEAMKRVMNWGAVRFSAFRETVVVNLVKPLTAAQIETIRRALWHNPDAVLVVEVDNPELDQIDYQEFTYPFTHWQAFIERAVAARRSLPQTSLIPQAQRKDIETLDRLIKEKRQDINWEKWPHGSISDARKAVYKDILNGFATVQEVKEYVEDMPEDSVIFTARGDEIPFSLIKLIIADIERNSWLSPFRPERRTEITWQPPLLPLVIRCAWCGKYMGEKEPDEDKSETHSICPECLAKYFPEHDALSPQTRHSIPRDDLKRIADKYGWWAAKLAESVCPQNDVACVEREARRLIEARRARLE